MSLFLFGEHCKGRGQIERDGEMNWIGMNDRKHTKIEQKLEKKQIKKIESQLKVGRGTVYMYIYTYAYKALSLFKRIKALNKFDLMEVNTN